MFRISHNDAIALENIVRSLYDCDRAGVSGLCDADNFESRPMDAAVMVVSYIHAHQLQSGETQYDEFLYNYENEFVYGTQENIDTLTKQYVNALGRIVALYC